MNYIHKYEVNYIHIGSLDESQTADSSVCRNRFVLIANTESIENNLKIFFISPGFFFVLIQND